jgi:hypothetical protein
VTAANLDAFFYQQKKISGPSGSEKHVKTAPNKDFSGSGLFSSCFFFLPDKRKPFPGAAFSRSCREMHGWRGFHASYLR